jgi:uncharacterized protein
LIATTFECFLCGECCSHLGEVHSIRKEYGDGRFLLYNRYTGEETVVTVSPEMAHLLSDRSIYARWPEACPFLRKEPDTGRICCTIHRTRPGICREFQCWRILISDRRGRQVGRVIGARHLMSEERTLSEIWEKHIRDINEPDTPAWEEEMIRILISAGYSVRR